MTKLHAATLLIALILGAPAAAEDSTEAGPGTPPAREPVRSIFDEQLREFRFHVGGLVSMEAAIAFARRYDKPDNPPIIGAYPDEREHVLVVVGPPEAERAIRETLVRHRVELLGLGVEGAVLNHIELERRELAADRRNLIVEINAVEVTRAEFDATNDDQRSQITQLDERVDALEAELTVVERKLTVVTRNLKRLGSTPGQEE